MQFTFANNVNTVTVAAITATDTAVTLASTANLPVIPEGQVCPGVLGSPTAFEIVYITKIVSGTLTILRGQEGTSAQPWGLGTAFIIAATAGSLSALQALINVVPNASTTLAVYQQAIVQVMPAVQAAATITVPAYPTGQIVRVFGGDYPITVSATLAFPDGSTASTYTIPDKDSGILMVAGDSGFRCQTFGQVIVAPATASNQAVPFGQVMVGNRKTVFTSNGTFTVPEGITSVWASGCAGGGGGGSSYTSQSGGGGGGYGQWVLNQPLSVTPGDTLTVTIGDGGAGGQTTSEDVAGVTVYYTAPGASGGSTTVVNGAGTTLLSLAGGGGGSDPDNSSSTTGPTAGGTGYPYGASGGYLGASVGGSGASGPFGGGGGGTLQNEATTVQEQLNASGYGAGGAGGSDLTPSGGLNLGGSGAPGYLVLEW